MIREQIREIEAHVPAEFLIRCEWGPPLKDSTQEAVDEAAIKHYEKAAECYLRHNSWVDFHESKTKNRVKGK